MFMGFLEILESIRDGIRNLNEARVLPFRDLAVSIADGKHPKAADVEKTLAAAGKSLDDLTAFVSNLIEVRRLRKLAATVGDFEQKRKVIQERCAKRKAEYDKLLEAIAAAEEADRQEDGALARAELTARDADAKLKSGEHNEPGDRRVTALHSAQREHGLAFENIRKLKALREEKEGEAATHRKNMGNYRLSPEHEKELAERAESHVKRIDETDLPAAEARLKDLATEIERLEVLVAGDPVTLAGNTAAAAQSEWTA
jgi:DNA-binding transcriptional MerR regulator